MEGFKMSVRVAIVEDDAQTSASLKNYILRYGAENEIEFQIQIFENAVLLLENYQTEWQIIFMDIDMPYLNGMDAAHRLRELDSDVLLIFVTNLVQYAVSGYEVDALDYIVKPVNYYNFAMKLARAVRRMPSMAAKDIMLSTNVGIVRLNPNDIKYLEVLGHKLIYHTTGQTYTQYSTLSKMEPQFLPYGFARCNNCYLVNLRYVKSIKGYTVNLDDCELRISQPRKKSFVQVLAEYERK